MKKLIKFLLHTSILLALLYTGAWFGGAYLAKQQLGTINDKGALKFDPAPSQITGFPFWPKIVYSGTINTPKASFKVDGLEITTKADAKQAKLNITAPNGLQVIDKFTKKAQKIDPSYIHLNAPYPLPKNHTKPEMEKWRQNHGEILVSSMLIKKGDIKITGTGMLGLDQALQPNGKINLSIAGYNSLMNELSGIGLIKKEHANLAGSILGQLFGGGTNKKKEESAFKTPLLIKSGHMFIGPMRVGKLSRINWPEK